MKRIVNQTIDMFAALGFVMALSFFVYGCTAAQQTAVSTAAGTVSAACTAAAPIILAAGTAGATNPAVASLIGYFNSVCSSASAISAAAETGGGGSTASWLVNIGGEILQLLPGLLTVL